MLRLPPPDRRRRLGAALALAVIAAACVEQDAPGVAVEAFEADLVFGVEDLAAPAPPPNSGQPARPAAGPAPAADVPTLPTFNDKSFLSRIPSVRRRVPCPPAPREEFADDVAGVQVEALPEVGLARWKQAGTQTYASLPDQEFPVQGFENRTIEGVEPIREEEDALEFRYMTTQEDFFSGAVVQSTFKVKTDGRAAGTSYSEIVTDESTTAGEPDRGVALEAIEYFDPKSGDLLGSSRFSPPVLYLPLPVLSGEEFQSFGVDVRTGDTLQHDAKVIGHLDVDACGDILDGWLVEATQTFVAGDDTFTRRYDYVIATQFGGVIIQEHVEAQTSSGSAKVTFSRGQQELSPLPDRSDSGTS